jgi:hypothetical protein
MGWVLELDEIFANNCHRFGVSNFLPIGGAVRTRIADESVVPYGV